MSDSAIISDCMDDTCFKKEKDAVLDKLRGLCSRREYSSPDIHDKALTYLSAKYGVPPELSSRYASEILESLKKDRYVDDSRFAEAFARDKAHISGWGAVKIRYSLKRKGLDETVIDSALEKLCPDKVTARMEKLLTSRYRVLKDDPGCRLKLLRYALGRGYTYDQADLVVKRLIEKK